MGESALAQVAINEVDVELALLGTLLGEPHIFEAVAHEIDVEWFSDQFGRYLFGAMLKLHDDGAKLSPPAIVAMLPEDCGGMGRGQFFARACASGVHAGAISGLIHTLKDRWARRTLLAAAEAISAEAGALQADPYILASDTVMLLDQISATRATKPGGTMSTAVQRLEASLADRNRLRGASTGLWALDNKLNGYKAGQLYVIAGRPGMGKSAFMCSSLRRTAQSGKGVAIFSLEMTEEEIAARCIADSLDTVTAPFFGNILKGQLSDVERQDVARAADALSDLPLYIDDTARLTFSEIAGRARREKLKFEAAGIPLAVLCIDHMGLVTPSDRYRGNKVAEAGEVSGLARALAKELDCCVILLCQLSREVEKRDDKRPVMSDLRWSGEIEQDAHVIGFLYREAYYLSQDPDADPGAMQMARNALEFLIRKNRNGETGDIRLWCSIGHSSVRDDI